MTNFQQTQKIPFITCEVSVGQLVCELVFGVNVVVLDLGRPNWLDQRTNQEQLCGFWKHVAHSDFLPLMIILITASNTYNKPSWWEELTFNKSTFFKSVITVCDCLRLWIVWVVPSVDDPSRWRREKATAATDISHNASWSTSSVANKWKLSTMTGITVFSNFYETWIPPENSLTPTHWRRDWQQWNLYSRLNSQNDNDLPLLHNWDVHALTVNCNNVISTTFCTVKNIGACCCNDNDHVHDLFQEPNLWNNHGCLHGHDHGHLLLINNGHVDEQQLRSLNGCLRGQDQTTVRILCAITPFVVVDESKCLEHSDIGIFNNLWASSICTWVPTDTASAACPSQPGNLEMISMIFAAVIWEAEDPCSVNTAQDPELSFTRSPRRTTRPLLLPQKFVIQTWFCNCQQYLCLLRIDVECNPRIHDPGKMLVLLNRLLC